MTSLFEHRYTSRVPRQAMPKLPHRTTSQADSFAVLLLATVSGVWDLGANEWNPRTDWHRVICPGPFFCGMIRGMRRGDYLEIEGELRAQQQERSVSSPANAFR